MTLEAIPFDRSRLRSVSEDELVSEFLRRALVAARAQYAAANVFEALDRFSNCVSVVGGVATALLGMYSLGAGDQFPGSWFSPSIAIVGALITLVGVLQAVFNWKERAVHHRRVGGRYSHAMRKLELIVSRKPLDRDALDEWNTYYTEIGKDAELVPQRMWRKASDEVGAP